MKIILPIIIVGVLMAACTDVKVSDSCEVDFTNINDDWDVALYFDSNAEPSATQMTLNYTEGMQLNGSFYGTPFEEAKATIFRNKVVFTVITSDGTGEYVTTGTLGCDDEINGQTLSRGRDFLMPWVATRKIKNK